jgi:hypothetical protein
MIDNDKETLFLSDDLVFYTIEGEGEYIGQPVRVYADVYV